MPLSPPILFTAPFDSIRKSHGFQCWNAIHMTTDVTFGQSVNTCCPQHHQTFSLEDQVQTTENSAAEIPYDKHNIRLLVTSYPRRQNDKNNQKKITNGKITTSSSSSSNSSNKSHRDRDILQPTANCLRLTSSSIGYDYRAANERKRHTCGMDSF